MKKNELILEDVISEYQKYHNLHHVAKLFKTSHVRISKILKENNIVILNRGKYKEFSEDDYNKMINDYIVNHLTMEAISTKYNIRIKRLRKYFRENNIIISKWNGYIKKEKKIKQIPIKINRETKKCPYCDWTTVDVYNKSHAYSKHLRNAHNVDMNEHILKYPEDEKFISNELNKLRKIKCEICGKYLRLIDNRHLLLHNITKLEYIQKYNPNSLTSSETKLKLQNCLNKMMFNEDWDRKSSKYENEIVSFLEQNNIIFIQHDRNILSNLELDIYIPSKQVAIEFNGLMWHSEWFGKHDKTYHLNKTIECNKKGIKLIHIFEDEYVNTKAIVYSKLRHILGIDDEGNNKIMGRKCTINEITPIESSVFLDKNHIQGFVNSSVYIGAFYNDTLIAVMSFLKEKDDNWNLSRFASLNGYVCQGVGSKLFNYFVKTYKPKIIKSFADRRWTLDSRNNLYTKLGFQLDKVLKPDYRYYNPKIDKYKRFHKFNLRKQYLHKKYGFSLDMSETEMVKELGYDRIWDCGLFKYVWKKETM